MLVSKRVLAFPAVAAAVLTALATPVRAQSPIPPDQGRARFAEARRLCEADGGRLWGVSLCGPIMFVDPASRAFVASVRDTQGIAREQDGVFVGTLPAVRRPGASGGGAARFFEDESGRAAEKAEVESVWEAVYADAGSVPVVFGTASMERYGGSSTPTWVFVDRAGIVRGYVPYRLTESEFERTLKEILR